MKAELKINCTACGIEDITIDLTIKGRTMPSFTEIRKAGLEQGWHIGRDCYCPKCYHTIEKSCDTCCNFEGNKTMGKYLCLVDGEFATPGDYCPNYIAK